MHFGNMTKLVDNDLSRKYRFQTKHSTKYAAGKLAQTARAVDRSTERWNWYQKQTRKFFFQNVFTAWKPFRVLDINIVFKVLVQI